MPCTTSGIEPDLWTRIVFLERLPTPRMCRVNLAQRIHHCPVPTALIQDDFPPSRRECCLRFEVADQVHCVDLSCDPYMRDSEQDASIQKFKRLSWACGKRLVKCQRFRLD